MCGIAIFSFEWLKTNDWDLVYYGFIFIFVPDVIFIIDRRRPDEDAVKGFVKNYGKWHNILKATVFSK